MPKAAPKFKKRPSSADSKAAKRCASTSPKSVKQKQAGQGRATASKAPKAKRADAKPAASTQAQPKSRQEQLPRMFDATATITVNSGSQKLKAAPIGQQSPSSTHPPLLPVSAQPSLTPEVAPGNCALASQQPNTPCAGPAEATGLSVRTQREATPAQDSPAPRTPAPVTPPTSDSLPLPVGLLLGSQPQPAPATAPAQAVQEQAVRALQPPVATAALPIPAPPIIRQAAQCSPEDLLLAVLTGAPRGTPYGESCVAPPATRLASPGVGGLAGLLTAQPPARVRTAGLQGNPWDNKRDEAEVAKMCVMCWETPRQTTLAPCGHRALCAPCTSLLLGQRVPPLCPICRCDVQSYILREFDA